MIKKLVLVFLIFPFSIFCQTNKVHDTVVKDTVFTASLFKLAQTNFKDGNLKKTSELMLIILNKTYPTGRLHDSIISFGSKLYNGFIANAEGLNNSEKYSEAEELLAVASQFCKSNKLIKCDERLEKTIKESKYGMYRSYLHIAESGINSHHPDIAESFVFSALAYKRKNEAYLKNYNDAENMIEKIIDYYLISAAKSIDKRNYTKAMKYFDKASAICDSLKNSDCNKKIKDGINSIKKNIYNEFLDKAHDYFKQGNPNTAEDYIKKAKLYKKENLNELKDSSKAEELLKQIKYVDYMKLYKEAEDYFKQGDYETCMKTLESADELEAKYQLENYNEKDSLEKHAAKFIIYKSIKSADIKIWGSDLAEAQNISDDATKMQAKYYLKNDSAVTKSINNLNEKISKKNCENFSTQFDVLIFKADNSADNKEFIDATNYYNEALKLANEDNSCNINATVAKERISKYEKEFSYQSRMAQTDYYYDTHDYKKVISEYVAAENYFTVNNLSGKGLTHVPLHYFLLNKKSNDLFIAAVNYYLDNSNNEGALTMLKALEANNYPALSARSLEETLATKLAKKDYELKKTRHIKSNIAAYTDNSRWFKWFKRRYRRTMIKRILGFA